LKETTATHMEENLYVTLQKVAKLAPPLVVTIGGFGFLCLGAGRLYLNHLYLQEGREALATVTSYTSHQTINPVSSSRTEYQFTTPDGTPMTGVQNGYTARVGEQIKIEYLADAPQWNRFAGAGHRYENWNIPTAVAGFLFFVAGLYATIRALRGR
jgi:cytochrome c biogenesis protein ResB